MVIMSTFTYVVGQKISAKFVLSIFDLVVCDAYNTNECRLLH